LRTPNRFFQKEAGDQKNACHKTSNSKRRSLSALDMLNMGQDRYTVNTNIHVDTVLFTG